MAGARSNDAGNAQPRRGGRLLVAFLFTCLFWAGVGAVAFAWTGARPGDAGPKDTKALVRRDGVGIAFSPKAGVTYQVYRHALGNGRRFVRYGAPVTYGGNGQLTTSDSYIEGQVGDSGWIYDATYDYLFYMDPGVIPYEEYYYIVASDADRDPVGLAIPDPNLHLNAYFVAGAFPPTQTRHGNYTEYTDACTACHGLHSAQSPQKLLKGPSITDLCGTCHDGSGSKYDIVMGRVRTGPDWTTFARNPAGPFGDQLRPVEGAPKLTSKHNVFRAALTATGGASDLAAQIWQAPGSTYLMANQVPGGSSWTNALTCASCHEPHNRFNNFRLLRGDFSYGDYNLPARGEARNGVNVRGVSEVFPAQTAVQDSWQGTPYTSGQAASKYLAGSSITGSAITDFCSVCHRAFTMPETIPSDPETIPSEVYGVWGEHRHKVGMPAADALRLGRIIDGPLGPSGDVCFDGVCSGQARLEDFNGTNLLKYVPLEGQNEDDPATTTANEYTENKVVCLTCHVAHGTGAAAGGFAATPGNPAAQTRLQLEVAYKNNLLNETAGPDGIPGNADDPQRDLTTGYLWNRNVPDQGFMGSGESQRPASPGGALPDANNAGMYAPQDTPYYTQFGSSSVLARFEPFASACYRCHSTKVP